MSALLPAGLPAGFALEPATGAHVAEVFELVAAEQVAAYGFCPDTEEDVRSLLELPDETAQLERLVRDTGGAVVQWWAAVRDPGDPLTHVWLTTHPRLPDAEADALARAGWAVLSDWIRSHPPDGVDGDLEVHSGCPAGSVANPRHLAEAGFTRTRTYWEMVGPVTDAHRAAPAVPGLAIARSRDMAAIHRILDTAFVGHHGFTPTTLDNFLVAERSEPGFDPDLRFLATVDDEPAAAMLLSRRAEAEGTMYVADLATLEQYRHRGIASALLAHAFDVAARAGLAQLALHVDSENTHAAPSVYRRAGLEVRTAWWVYERVLSR